jgi:hypothetical protein
MTNPRRQALTAVASQVLAAALLAMFAGTAKAAPTSTSSRVFRGNGGETLTPFRVSTPSTLFWANNGGIFQIFPSGLNGSVNSQAAKGWTYLPSGSYTLQVNAIGSWAIDIESGVVRPSHLSGGWLSYSGNGGMTLPPFRIPRGEQLFWSANGGIFQIFSNSLSGANVNSQARKGSTYVSGGYQQLQINTTGAWRITWRP